MPVLKSGQLTENITDMKMKKYFRKNQRIIFKEILIIYATLIKRDEIHKLISQINFKYKVQ